MSGMTLEEAVAHVRDTNPTFKVGEATIRGTLILTRPQGGWSDVQALMDDPIVQRIDPSRVKLDELGLVSSLIEVSANVSYRGYDMTMRYLFEAVPGRPIRTLRRERVG